MPLQFDLRRLSMPLQFDLCLLLSGGDSMPGSAGRPDSAAAPPRGYMVPNSSDIEKGNRLCRDISQGFRYGVVILPKNPTALRLISSAIFLPYGNHICNTQIIL